MHSPNQFPLPFPVPDVTAALFALRHLERGRAYLEVGRVEQALGEFTRAAALDPGGAEPRLLLSLGSYQAERYADALRHADAAVHLSPQEEWGYRLRFYALRVLGRKQQAFESARHAVRLEPEGDAALHALLLAHLDTRRYAGAEVVLQQLEAVAPDQEDTHEAGALTYLALHQYEKAETAARHALALNPESAYAFRYLGDALRGQRRYQDAWHAYREAGLLAPNDAYVYAGIRAGITERIFPLRFVAWRQTVNLIGAVVACYAATVVTGQAAVGWTLAFFNLVAGTIFYTLDDGMHLVYWRRNGWAEIPANTQAFLWRAKLVSVPPSYSLGVLATSLLMLIVLTCLCIGYPVSIASDRGSWAIFWAWTLLIIQLPLFCRGFWAYAKAQEAVSRMKPVELLPPDPSRPLQTANEPQATGDAKLPLKVHIARDVHQKSDEE